MTLVNSRTHGKERMSQLLVLQGKEHDAVDVLGNGMIGAVPKLKDTATGDVLADVDQPAPVEPLAVPAPVISFAIEPVHKGEEEKVFSSLRRLAEEDPSLDIHRDPQTGETIVGGLSQMHVEIVLERLHRRFGVEVALSRRACPTARRSAAGRGRRAATRSRPAAAASSATATSRSSRSTTTRATSSSTRSSAA